MDYFEKEAVKERREFNRKLYSKLFKITKKPKKILDIGCGINPIYFPYRDIYYYALDPNEKTLKILKKHFRKNKGKAIYWDLEEEIPKYKADIVFLFKVLDYFSKKKKFVKELISKLNSNWIIVSFPTRTVSGRRMKKPKRKWFENLIKELDFEVEIVRFYNEIFYVVKK